MKQQQIKYLKAYTLTEALITIVLSSIIVMVSYNLVTTISKQLSMFQKENKEEMIYNLANSALHFDINQAEDFYFREDHIALYYYDNDTINYYFNKESIVRQSRLKLDTFKIEVIDIEMIDLNRLSNLKLKLKIFDSELNTFYPISQSLSKALNKKYFYEN